MARRLLILGSTGSVGTQALDIVARAGDEFELVGLSAERSWEPLVEQARAHGVSRIALADADAAARASEAWTDGEVLAGAEGLVRLVLESEADLVLNALVGSAGLGPTVATLGEGIDLALANKESLVVGGELVMQLAEATGAQILPVDSEHSALHQLLAGERAGTVDKLVLTASGGPFRGRTRAELEEVTVAEALAHPTWDMGGKISIDSATLMNKGLELIEAHHLFGTPYDQIDVVVHPQSIVHSYVLLCDGAALAHLGYPDMRVPISYALHHPERVDVPMRPLDLAEVGALTFEPVDTDAFPCLRLAREAAVAGGTAPCVLNAANEVAVHAFLNDGLGFLGIAEVIESTLERLPPAPIRAFETLYDADREARAIATELIAVRAERMSWFLAFVGFAALIVLHEFGHFIAAKAVGMRVERFMLFFPPILWKVKRGETEYGIGAIPLGGYVRISGMNPHEELPPEVQHRAYYKQKPWKRIVVILAGPVMNLLIAFVLLWAIFAFSDRFVPTHQVGELTKGSPAAEILKPGDRLIAVDGVEGDTERLREQISTHSCPGRQTEGCTGSPVTLQVERGERTIELTARPRYNAEVKRPLLGFAFDSRRVNDDGAEAVGTAVSEMWNVTSGTVSIIGKLFYDEEARDQVSGVVGSYERTRQAINLSVTAALYLLAVISLSLAVVNLFPFLPLDGGHVFWAAAEKVRGRAIPFRVMERAGLVGFVLVAMLFFLGLTNDIGRLRGEGIGIR